MRVRKEFTRSEGFRSARLVVIAAEGRNTESIYFGAVRARLKAAGVHVEILRRDDGNSSPASVFAQLQGFMQEYNIRDDDQLWVVVDRDRWTQSMLASVARHCQQNANLRFCLSNPCFELWLLLHLEDVAAYSEEEKARLAANRKNSKYGSTWLKQRMRDLLGSYQEANYDAFALLPGIDDAIGRSRTLDTNPRDSWPQTIGTRVHLLVESIMDRKEGKT